MHGLDETIGQRSNGFAIFNRPLDDFVVDIGNVSDIGHLVATRPEPTTHNIKDHHDPGVPDVAEIVDRHTADIHSDMPRRNGLKIHLRPG